ncbi:MAG: hypothetical protein GY761_22075 [Hyphomicrobiales bacterium]|nr:hypothetical protein [Hyphomicrobiales bacterium]
MIEISTSIPVLFSIIAQVRQPARTVNEHAKGRRLYVATTNLDAGELVIWDMGEIANGGRINPVQRFQKFFALLLQFPDSSHRFISSHKEACNCARRMWTGE